MDLLRIKDLKDLQAVLDLMQRNDLAELEIEEEGQRIRLRKIEVRTVNVDRTAGLVEGLCSPAASRSSVSAAGVPGPAPAVSVGEVDSPGAASAADGAGTLDIIHSPLVGTFYRAPSPEADPFVQEGDRVDDDTVLAIVEAMKVMNEIRAGKAGLIREILVKNGEPVEYGQPLFRLEPAV
jgi:acetyl-CoA carboxylase biotin carboxyl carrier protein